jgi:SAM-dependent methyltransferase
MREQTHFPVQQPTELISRWYTTPMGARMAEDLAQCLGHLADDAFGYHAVMVGAVLPCEPRLRIRARTQVAATREELAETPLMAVQADFDYLPIETESADLVIALHVLESTREPHDIMRELDRIIRPEGRVLIVGVNPVSLWNLKKIGQQTWQGKDKLAQSGYLAGQHRAAWRVVDWLRLLGYDVQSVEHLGGLCPTTRPRFYDKMRSLRTISSKWLWFMQGFYVIDAVRRVSTPTAIRPAFRLPRMMPNKTRATVANQTTYQSMRPHKRQPNGRSIHLSKK